MICYAVEIETKISLNTIAVICPGIISTNRDNYPETFTPYRCRCSSSLISMPPYGDKRPNRDDIVGSDRSIGYFTCEDLRYCYDRETYAIFQTKIWRD